MNAPIRQPIQAPATVEDRAREIAEHLQAYIAGYRARTGRNPPPSTILAQVAADERRAVYEREIPGITAQVAGRFGRG